MNQIQPMAGHTVVRVCGLPEDKSLAESLVRQTIQKYSTCLTAYQISVVPSCVRDDESDAFVDFEVLPGFLSSIKNDPLGSWQTSIEGRDLSFDRHFIGFTQLYRPMVNVQADVVAICGLDGHAYGSWQGRGGLRRMWLRHFLSLDLPNCRTMIYGYNAKLARRNFATAEDYTIEFVEALKTVRTRQTSLRPIIFVAHSFGGLLLARSIILAKQMNEEPALSSILGILFFAVPHLGIDIEDMSKIMSTEEHPRVGLLQHISINSQPLRSQLRDFVDVLMETKIQVVSFYETEQSHRLMRTASGDWKRTGEPFTSLEASNAILQLPSYIETRVPLHEDHSKISKFDKTSDRGYCIALSHLKKWLEQRSSPATLARTNSSWSYSTWSLNGDIEDPSKKSCYVMPFKNLRFLGREDKLYELEQKFFLNNKAQRAAIFGLGGVGKTQLALAYSYAVRERHPDYSIFWVSALSAARFKHDYTRIAKKLNLATDSKDDEDLIQIIQDYLSSEAAGKWLLIIDNSDDKNVLFEGSECVSNCLPQSETGIILYTTRYKDIAMVLADGHAISLEEMSTIEAKEFFQKSLGENPCQQEEDSIDELLKELTCLPLAIVQAASFISKNSISVARYLDLMRSSEEAMINLLSKDFWDNTRENESRNPVALTWLITFELIRKHEPYATEVLYHLAFLENKAIPWSILPSNGSEVDLIDAMGTLTGYSFLTKSGNAGQEMYDMHRLVHRATKVWMQKEGSLKLWREKTVTHLVNVSPALDWDNRRKRRQYIPHAIRVLDTAELAPSAHRADLCSRLAACLEEDRRVHEATKWRSEWVSWRSQSLPADDRGLLRDEMSLAILLNRKGEAKQALELLDTLAIRLKGFREDDEIQLLYQFSLARVLLQNGHVKEALEMTEKVVATQTKRFTEDDPGRLKFSRSLATIYYLNGEVGKYMNVLETLRVTLTTIFTEYYHDRVVLENALALAYMSSGQGKKAVEMQEAVATRAITLAEDDPDRLDSEDMLGRMYCFNGQLQEAIQVLEKVVATRTRVLTEDHPDLLRSRNALIRACETNTEVKEIVKDWESTVASTWVLTEDNLDRTEYQHQLALAYELDGQTDNAIALMRYIVSVRQQILSIDHPSRSNSEADLSRMLNPDTNIWHTEYASYLKDHLTEGFAEGLTVNGKFFCPFINMWMVWYVGREAMLQSQEDCKVDTYFKTFVMRSFERFNRRAN